MAGRASKADSKDAMFLRGQIIKMWELGASKLRIAEELGVCRSTVQKWIRRFEEEGKTEAKPRSGRPRCTTREEDGQILAMVANGPVVTAVKITRTLNLACDPQTVRNRLEEANKQCHVPAVKECLNTFHREARLGFALEYIQKDLEFWNTVIFTDEKVFSTVEAISRHCWREKGTRYAPENIIERKTSGRKTVSFWGWMWAQGPGELVKIEGRFDSRQYIEILEEVLLPSVRAMAIPPHMPITLVQDNSSIHKSKMVREWLDLHPDIIVIDWPPKGCDLNPIEHVWAAMSKDWMVGEPRNAAAVEETARRVWETFRWRPDFCQNLVASMPKRLNKVIDANGGWTGY